MARIRSVKPQLRTSRVVAQWKREVRYFWVLLWGYLDDEGRGFDTPKAIAGDCFPLDEDMTPAKVNKWLELIASTKLDDSREPPLCRYSVAGQKYIHAVNWTLHQRPNRPSPSQHPPCPIHDLGMERFSESSSESSSESDSESSSEPALSPQVLEFEYLTEGEVESDVREPVSEIVQELEPPPRCPRHMPSPAEGPCGPCGDARIRLEEWRAARRERLSQAPRCKRHPHEPAHNCRDCRSEAIAVITGEHPPVSRGTIYESKYRQQEPPDSEEIAS